jgi:hypothetical protein
MADREARDDLDVGGWRESFEQFQRPGSDDCPEDQRLAAMVLGELDAIERDPLADHVTLCHRCSRRVRDLLDLHRAAGASGEQAPRAPGRSRFLGWFAAAAAVLIVAVGAGWLLRDAGAPHPAAPTMRGSEALTEAVEPTDRARLTEAPTRLHWTTKDSPASYRVVLYDRESTPIWESDWVTGGSVSLPVDVQLQLRPGDSYLWRVFSRVGIEERQSPVYRFELVR